MQTYFIPIFHITTEKEWEDCVDDNYYPDAFSSEGFIHFSTRKQLVNTEVDPKSRTVFLMS